MGDTMRIVATLIALVIGFPAFAEHTWLHKAPEPPPAEQGSPYQYDRSDYDFYHTNHYYGLTFDSAIWSILGLMAEDNVEKVRLDPGSEVAVLWGQASDVVGRHELISYLREDSRHSGFVRRWDSPPVIRFQFGTPQAAIDATLYTVQVINSALPMDWQISIDFTTVFRSPANPEIGEILIGTREQWKWPVEFKGGGCAESTSIGCARGWTYTAQPGEIAKYGIMVDPTQPDTHGLHLTLMHEIQHALGRSHPIDLNRTDTIMSYNHLDLPILAYPIDRDALYAVYSRLDVGTRTDEIYRELGPWDETSRHMFGVIDVPDIPSSTVENDGVAFGVRTANGHAQPWVLGPEPSTYIWENPELHGSATWIGNLIGFTPSSEAVMGDAALRIDLTALDGDLDFTRMEKWAARQKPVLGAGRTWGDGDLHYSVQIYHNDMDSVFGNITPEVGDDEGIVDGGFFGEKHEAMGGTLRRDDLTAAFGGKR